MTRGVHVDVVQLCGDFQEGADQKPKPLTTYRPLPSSKGSTPGRLERNSWEERMSFRKAILTTLVVGAVIIAGPNSAQSDLCYHCHETCIGGGGETCYAWEKCEGDYCEASTEDSICQNID